jgi:hypothetical protein
MTEIDDVIKREFERLGINLVSNEDLAELVILKANQRRRHQFLWSFLGFIAALTLGFGIYLTFSVAADQTSNQKATIIENASVGSNQSRVIILDLKGDGKNPLEYSTNVEIQQGQFLELVSEIPEFARGLAGTLTVTPAGMADSTNQIGRFDLGYGTHINEFGAFFGKLKLNYTFEDPNFQGRVRLVIGIK